MTVLHANERTDFKRSSRTKIRQEGLIPAVVYGNNTENKSIAVNSKDFIKTIRETGRNGIISLEIGSDKRKVMLYDYQIDPLKSEEFIHLDFHVVNFKSEIDVDVNVNVTGNAAGVKDGGVLQQVLHAVSIKVLPNDVPDAIEVDVSELNVNDTITIGDLNNSGKYTFNHEEEEVLVSILPPRVEEVVDSGEVQEPSEPELVDGREENKDNTEEA
ncbi:50S ribosomal protein L25/general stress protein Ctc [Sutcliffiella rhizosphaerae]|uniref:Large ribosomal subunit protein bL25 n=1 Tax=Sutcliffiella rhizosphaerae TaxID=2880967 RepID=A0ABN8AJL6_9BACI|nr:50S ribosomal protein L25/general stress protein Ctc [Sutcliffiella rhizosphaerae]CAG9623080.1 General stress protein CTC [Sutcliffiella rhizosphaerae]